ncbi:hypothetical protein [Leptolyngbya sp. GB1-A1]|uniref:hypothetical protein n=1 Tax=Leptolyngbya sp. GB1-A1 TaxID=2933908 RepID=UPI003299745B
MALSHAPMGCHGCAPRHNSFGGSSHRAGYVDYTPRVHIGGFSLDLVHAAEWFFRSMGQPHFG